MKKANRQLALLAAVAVVLGGAYAGLTAWNRYSEAKEEQKAQKEEEAAKIYLCQAEEPIQIEVTNESGTFSFTYEEENGWKYDKDEHFPVIQTKVTAITSKVESLEAVRRLDGAEDDLSVYGLAEPIYTLTVTEDGKEPVTIYVGDSSEASGDYYVKLEGDDSVYTVASTLTSSLDISEDSILQTETFPSITSSAVTMLTWKTDNGEVVVRKDTRIVEPETIEVEEMQTEAEPETENYWLIENDGEIEDTTTLDELLTLISELEYADCTDYYMEANEAEDYGLAEGYDELVISYTVSDEQKETILKIGGLTEAETDFYVIVDDSKMVNLLDAASVVQIQSFFE